MKIFITQHQEKDPGTDLPINDEVRKLIPSWSTSYFKAYPFGRCLVSEYTSTPLRIYIYKFWIEKPQTLYMCCEEATAAFQATLRGEIPGGFKSNMNIVLEDNTCQFIYLPAGLHEVTFKPGIIELFHVEIAPSFLTELTRHWHDRQEFLQMVIKGTENGKAFPRSRITHLENKVINDLRQLKQQGHILNAELVLAIRNLIRYNLFAIDKNWRIENRNYSEYDMRFVAIYNEIVSKPHIKYHHLQSIQNRVSIESKTLSRNFARLFNIQGVYTFVRDACMRKALMLLEEGNIDLEDIATEIGYDEVNSFKRAFIKKYNVPPEDIGAKPQSILLLKNHF